DSATPLPPGLGPEGPPGGRPHPRQGGAGCGQHPGGDEEGGGPPSPQASQVGDRQRREPGRARGHRPALRQGDLRRPRADGQAHPPGADGAGVPHAQAAEPRDDQARHQEGRRESVREEDTVGQKTHPYGFRLVYNKTWHSRWYGDTNYADTLHQDLKLRKQLKPRLSHAGVSEIDIERAADKLRVTIYTSRPGIIIGRRGAEVDKLRDDLQKEMGREV